MVFFTSQTSTRKATLSSSAVINLERCVTTTANSTGITINAGSQVISYGNNQIAGNTVSDGNPTLTITQR